jgi:FtsP/CotA-like multicopper oxidase with cupredoxin domain
MERRALLQALACLPALAGCATRTTDATPRAAPAPRRLRAAPAVLPMAGQPALPVWAYDGQVPGPVLRLRRGQLLDVELHNALPDATTIHWHGIRLPNAMDGVPHLTQPPVAPGGRFRYRFALPDAGTFWYHPHLGTPEQVGRGLAGAVVVEDDEPPPCDADLVWLLGDWRLDAGGRIAEDFYAFRDVSHAGRLGQRLTVDGQIEPVLPLAAGQRLRLRLRLRLVTLPTRASSRSSCPACRPG